MARESSTQGPFDLERFVAAQAGVIAAARAEIAAGRKQSHWIWFIFPQIAGLGRSAMAQRYAIASLAEARAFLAHPVLGPRLEAMTRLALGHAMAGAHVLFGSPDDLKFHSSMTLFAQAAGAASIFHEALDRFFAGAPDRETLARL